MVRCRQKIYVRCRGNYRGKIRKAAAGFLLLSAGCLAGSTSVADHFVSRQQLANEEMRINLDDEWFDKLHVVLIEEARTGHHTKALRVSRQMLEIVRARYQDDRGLTDREFEQAFPITSAYGYRFISRLHIAQNGEISSLLALGRYDQAVGLLKRDLYLDRKLLGQASPYYLDELVEYALMAKVSGEYNLARTWLEEAIRVSQIMFGRESVELANSLRSLAALLVDLQLFYEAEDRATRTVAMYKSLGIESGRDYRATLDVLSLVFLKTEQLGKAERIISEIISDLQLAGLTESLEYGSVLGRVATVLKKQGKFDQSEKYYRAAILNAKNGLPETEVVYAYRVKVLADLYHLHGSHYLATKLYDQVRDIFDENGMEFRVDERHSHDKVGDVGPLTDITPLMGDVLKPGGDVRIPEDEATGVFSD